MHKATHGRHYGLDWLRIGAFGLLILYHIGMVYVPWDYHVKAAATADWLEWPMLLLNPWRMALLFLISGYATRRLLARAPGLAGFARARSRRLGIPLLFGIAVVVPPQAWVELVGKHGYADSYLWFWAHDYFRFGKFDGIILPTWNHLWFVAYLLVYTLLVAAALAAGADAARWQRRFDALFAGARLWLLPVGWYAALRLTGGGETHALFDDWYGHLFYLPAFVFGIGLAGAPQLVARTMRHWPALLLIALAAYATRMAYNTAFSDVDDSQVPVWLTPVAMLARPVQIVATLLGLVGWASARLDVDHPWRAPLTAAVFPWYVVHQTALVLVAWWLKPLGWSIAAQFATVLAATVAACALAGWAAARWRGVGVLLGGAAVAGARRPHRRRHDGVERPSAQHIC